jgi:hypothetical protein
MKAKGPRQIRTYAERRNALRLATEQELISYGKAIGLRLMAVAANHKQNIANDRLIEMIAYANFLLMTEVNADAENATEQIMQYLDKVMGEGWEDKADKICEKMCEEWRAAHGGT